MDGSTDTGAKLTKRRVHNRMQAMSTKLVAILSERLVKRQVFLSRSNKHSTRMCNA